MNKARNLKERNEGHMGSFGGKKGKEEMRNS